MQELAHGLIAASPAENEVDRWQEPFGFELFDRPVAAWDQIRASITALRRVAFDAIPGPAPSAMAAVVTNESAVLLGQLHQFGVDLACHRDVGGRGGLLAEEVVEPSTGHDMLKQRDRSAFTQDDTDVTANLRQPVTELLGVRHGRGQGHELDIGCEPDDDFLPDRAAEAISEVMHLVHDDESQIA